MSEAIKPKGAWGCRFKNLRGLSKDMSSLLMNKESSDVTIRVKTKRFFCHKAILAARNEYFRALLYGNLKESRQSEIELKEISPAAFQIVLTYIYTGILDLINLKVERILDTLQIAHQYQFEYLEDSLSIYLTEVFSISNVFAVFEKAKQLNISQLENVCGTFIDNHADEMLLHNSFVTISAFVLEAILCRETFFDEEINIFRAVHKWVLHNRSKLYDKEAILKLLRLPLISCRDMINEVWPSNLFSDPIILGAMKIRFSAGYKELNYRGSIIIEQDVATAVYNSTMEYDYEPAPNGSGDKTHYKVEIKLGKNFVINCIRVFRNADSPLVCSENCEVFYGLEKSQDGKKWVNISNYEKGIINGFNFKVCFPTTVARQFCFRVAGLGSDLVRVECMYSQVKAAF